MKRIFIIVSILLVLLPGAAWGCLNSILAPIPSSGGLASPITVRDGGFCTASGESFSVQGISLDGKIPYTYDAYLSWLRRIGSQNINLIQADAILPPGFYHALYDYNQDRAAPIYLLQGLSPDVSSLDLYQGLEWFQAQLRSLADLLHGRKVTAQGIYRWDLSPWVFGYRLGTGWTPEQILYTNDLREAQSAYEGTCLCTTKDASPFEAFLARAGDALLEYEASVYGTRHLLTFGNTPETDPLSHESWLLDQESNLAQANMEHIQGKEPFRHSLFASYTLSPEEPFLLYALPYASFVDETGTVNPYQGYLRSLRDFHSLPLLISGPAGDIVPWEDSLNPAATLDGDLSEWEDTPWLLLESGYGLQCRYDEVFLYFHIFLKDRSGDSRVYLPVDITPHSGSDSAPDQGLAFSQNVDFLLCLEENSATLLVQEYYDQLHALHRREVLYEDAFLHPPEKDSAKFSLVQTLHTPPLRLADGEFRKAVLLPSGILSQDDLAIHGDHMELRLPWALLNVSDPARMLAHDDYYANYGIRQRKIESMNLSLQILASGKSQIAPFVTLKLKSLK